MNKQEAADLLGVSTRAIERYTAKGKLTPTYPRGKTGHIADYDKAELESLKKEMEAPRTSTSTSAVTTTTKTDKAKALTLSGPAGLTEILDHMIAALKGKATAQDDTAPVSTLSVADKLTLSISEASHLSGLSRNHLTQAIHAKKLKAKIIGRGWRIKRVDLDAYVKKL